MMKNANGDFKDAIAASLEDVCKITSHYPYSEGSEGLTLCPTMPDGLCWYRAFMSLVFSMPGFEKKKSAEFKQKIFDYVADLSLFCKNSNDEWICQVFAKDAHAITHHFNAFSQYTVEMKYFPEWAHWSIIMLCSIKENKQLVVHSKTNSLMKAWPEVEFPATVSVCFHGNHYSALR